MKVSITVLLGLRATLAKAQGGVPAYEETDGTGGSGPYKVREYRIFSFIISPLPLPGFKRPEGLTEAFPKAYFQTDPELPTHTSKLQVDLDGYTSSLS